MQQDKLIYHFYYTELYLYVIFYDFLDRIILPRYGV